MVKTRLIFLLFVIFMALFFISNAKADDKYTYLDVTLLNQDPYPAQPDDYVDLVFKVENTGGAVANDVIFEIIPQYPFSLDPGADAATNVGYIMGVQYGEHSVFVKYKLRVDKDAIDGDNEIKIRYVYNTQGRWINPFEREFNISIEDPKTDFDIAIQDYSPKTNTLSIAVSNIGDKNANSVTVMLPEQSLIDIIGSDKNILGGIESNDYTIASFKVMPEQDGPLVVRISYTDTIGIRREVEKAVIFKASSYAQATGSNNAKQDYRAIVYIAIGIVGIIVIFILFRVLRKRRK